MGAQHRSGRGEGRGWRAALWAVVALGIVAGCRSKPGSQPEPTSTAPAVKHPRLRLLTYNVLADPVFRRQRSRALFALLEQSKADVIALQEAASWFVGPLLEQPWVKGRYHHTERNGRPFSPGGQLILSRFPIRRVDWGVLPGRQRRTVLKVVIRVNGQDLAVATSHLESYLPDGPVRAKQLDAIFSLLGKFEHGVLLGDLNFGDGEQPDTKHLDRRYVDLWTRLRPGAAGHTWNIAQNPLARVGSFQGEPSRRLDRILVRSSGWRPAKVRLLGNRAVGRSTWFGRPFYRTGDPAVDEAHVKGLKMDVFPSDHYGLLGELVWK